jgi:hypothetical protein
MILALYIIGSAFAILVLAHKLRSARHDLKRVTWERDAFAATIQAPRPAPSYADLAAAAADRRVLPSAMTPLACQDRRPEE